jgi:Tfp pilus assembly protein PilO
MTLVTRILFETRSVVAPLALVLLVNLGVYAFVVYPLEAKAANAEERAASADQSLQSAKRDLAAALALATGKTRADQELTTFYGKVLPENFSSALRLTYTRVPVLARKLNLKFETRAEEVDKATVKDQRYGRIKTRIVLQGDYEAIRRFVYQLETAPEFVIIDDVALAQSETDKPLTLTLALSTYYRLGADGT